MTWRMGALLDRIRRRGDEAGRPARASSALATGGPPCSIGRVPFGLGPVVLAAARLIVVGPPPAGCVDRPALAEAVSGRLGRDPFVGEAGVTVIVEIARSRRELSARVTFVDGEG